MTNSRSSVGRIGFSENLKVRGKNCAHCHNPIERCTWEDHGPWSLCKGWRHVTFGDASPLVCPGESAEDHKAFTVAEA